MTIDANLLSSASAQDPKRNLGHLIEWAQGLQNGDRTLKMNPASTTPVLRLHLSQAQGGVAAEGIEVWHEVGATSEPAFTNSWVNLGGGSATAAFKKDVGGNVHIKGLVKSGVVGAGTPIFTLPAGYRPGATLIFAVVTNPNTIGVVNVLTTGAVEVAAGSNVAVTINITFNVGA